ncbi:hypothetical protein WMY93_000051 [Mugilogobius chulae]|uniref:Uncharacterized protein n=1 Tax=Mugilogobius chulae TaxID=88201 RepID=A0AAW0PZS7_9GOBI
MSRPEPTSHSVFTRRKRDSSPLSNFFDVIKQLFTDDKTLSPGGPCSSPCSPAKHAPHSSSAGSTHHKPPSPASPTHRLLPQVTPNPRTKLRQRHRRRPEAAELKNKLKRL